MPKRTPEGITVGFLGTGLMEVNTATGLIEEYLNESLQGEETVRFVFPLTTDEFSDTMGDLVSMAKASEITYEVLRATEDKERRAFQDIASGAAKTYDVPDVFTQMENILVEAPRSILMMLWDTERDEELTEIASKFIDAEIDVRDLTDGMTKLGVDDDAEEATTIEAAPEAEEVGEAEEAEEAAPLATIYARSDLERKSRDEVKAVAASLGLAPRRSSAAMIDEILTAQGTSEIAPEAPVSPQEPPPSSQEVEEVKGQVGALVAFMAALDEWSNRLSGVFDDFLNRLDKVEVKVATPAPTPTQPEATAPRRLRRG